MAILKVANIHFDAAGTTRLQANGANVLTIVTGNTEDARFDASGNLLISRIDSTVGQSVKLDVNGAINASAVLINGASVLSTSNSYTQTVGTAGNAYAQAVGTAGNNYTITVGAAANGWANTISATRSTASNAYADTVGTAGNNYTITVGAAANGWANTISATRSTASNAYAQAVGTAGNAYAVTVGTAGNAYAVTVGTAGNAYAQAVGTAGNNYTITVGAAANGWANTISATRTDAANGWANTISATRSTASNTYAETIGLASNTIAIAAFAKANATTYTSNLVISVADNTNAALRITQTGTGEAFRVEDEANPDSTPFVITATGNVIIGRGIDSTVGLGVKLDVNGAINTAALYVNGAPITGGATILDDAVNATRYVTFVDSTSGTMTKANVDAVLSFNPSTGTLSSTIFNSTSDETLKYDVKPIENALGYIDEMNGVSFKWKKNDQPSIGVIAQDIEKVLPELVGTDGENKTVNYNGIIAVLIQAVKELSKRVEELESK